MRTYKIANTVIIIFLIVIAICGLLSYNSIPLALNHAGLTFESMQYIEGIDIEADGDHFSVIQTYTDSGKVALALLKKNTFGFWVVDRMSACTNEKPVAQILWSKSAGISRFSPSDAGDFENECHYVYAGNNAKKQITITPSMLPANCAANVRQAGSLYVIHIICFSTDYPQINMTETLINHGFIEE